MADSTSDSERTMQAARQSLAIQRAGGTHRSGGSIGQRSADIKRKHFTKKLIQIALGIMAVFIAAGVAGAILNGIGFWGVMASVLAILVVTAVVSTQKLKVPQRADLTKGDVRNMVGKTEMWLEHQRLALPPPAAKIVEDMGVQLDSLGLQLETIDQSHPAAREVRKLVGEILPETVDSYKNIPVHLRGEKRAGSTPDEQIAESLGKISKEIDSVTRQLAEGSLDNLAIKTRYLEYKYGEGDTTAPENT